MNSLPCPIWKYNEYQQNTELHNQLLGKISINGELFTSPRAGGTFVLTLGGWAPLYGLSDLQKAHISYWISEHNRHYSPINNKSLLYLDQNWILSHKDRKPSYSDRILSFLRKLIDLLEDKETIRRSYDKSHDVADWLSAASGCRDSEELAEFTRYSVKQGWIHSHEADFEKWERLYPDLSGRMFVEEQERVNALSRQGFVAMWFDKSLDEAFEKGFKQAIKAAGYEAYRVDQDEYLGKIDDQIIAAIRQSRFVVADFTCSAEGARGNVYYEAGFAQGLGIPVIFTCRDDEGWKEKIHFDTSHINHLVWKDCGDLKKKLQKRIEATIGKGPIPPVKSQEGNSNEASE